MEQQDFFLTLGLTSSEAERRVKTYRSQESEPVCRKEAERALPSRSTSCGLPENCDPDGLYGRMWREVSIPRTPPTSSASSLRLGTAGILSRGACWTRSMSEWTGWSVPSRRDAGVCGLSDVLEPMSPSLLKYFLSPTALQGILRRADARGKALPTLLADAIAYMLEWWTTHPELAEEKPAHQPVEVKGKPLSMEALEMKDILEEFDMTAEDAAKRLAELSRQSQEPSDIDSIQAPAPTEG